MQFLFSCSGFSNKSMGISNSLNFLLLLIFIPKCFLFKFENNINNKFSFLTREEKIKDIQNKTNNDIDNIPNHYMKKERKQDLNQNINSEFITLKRFLIFNISKKTECNVAISDIVLFKTESDINYIEHWIFHNNVENIEPKSVTSKDVLIKFFTFNKKMNSFSVYFESDQNIKNKKEFTINFEYDAINLIRSVNNYPDIDTDSVFLDDKRLEPLNKDNDLPLTAKYNYSIFLWKLYNKNFLKDSFENLSIEINFELGTEFSKYLIFSQNNYFNFNKTILNNNPADISKNDNSIVKYEWDGLINSQELVVMEIRFPFYIENCKYDYFSILMVILGSIIVVFVTSMLYIVFNSVIFNDF